MFEPDDLVKAIEEDFEGATKLSVADFARLIGMKPQLVHYYIRRKVFTKERCVCGRFVIDVEEGLAAFSQIQSD